KGTAGIRGRGVIVLFLALPERKVLRVSVKLINDPTAVIRSYGLSGVFGVFGLSGSSGLSGLSGVFNSCCHCFVNHHVAACE
ncbi:MAG: hypothetical protein ACREIJ_09090, partial [Nitrospiraceae bacterium]